MAKDKSSAKWWILGLAAAGILFLMLITTISAFAGTSFGGNTAHIRINGVITNQGESFFGTETVSSEIIVANIKKAEQNSRIKAILLDINSPGGSAVASEEVATAIQQANKPVVALIRDIGTSGAYWAASSSDAIIASPLSITGSVGATATYLEFSGLMQKYGVGYERLVSGEYKDTGSPFRKLTEKEELLLQEMVKATGSYFAESVRKDRNLDFAVADEIATGRIYSGEQALKLGLVDELGNIATASEAIKKLTGVEEVRLVEYKTKKPLSLASFLSQQAAVLGRSIGANMFSKGTISLT
ncbi:signal peptide peptidase SppA [Candidatus Woesearchaeota archaeon]|nr:signal peptide peptidase SppA [Candidatus Woesearchaeota archaeon]